MKKIFTFLLILYVFLPNMIFADMLGNPNEQVGKRNLFVGVEYSSNMHIYDLDTVNGLETSSERIILKVTTGLSDRIDIFLKAGSSNLMLDYKKERNAIKNFDSDMSIGFGGGTRISLLNFVDSGTRVFFQGGGFFFKADDNFQWQKNIQTTTDVQREIKWLELYAGLGIVKRMDFVDLNFGVGFSDLKWWINDIEIDKVGSIENRIVKPERDSFEIKNPLFGFIGLDFILPYEYRISAQAGIRNLDEAEFSVAINQGLQKD